MAVRKADEPPIIDSAKPWNGPKPVPSNSACLYATDSSEFNRVRSAVDVGTVVEVRCAFTTRPLTGTEKKAYRNLRELPQEVVVAPESVTCTVVFPNGKETTTPVTRQKDGGYSASFEVTVSGGWFYTFEGTDLWVGTITRAVDVKPDVEHS